MTVSLDIDLTLYDIAAVLRACYRFTDRYYLSIERKADQILCLRIASKEDGDTTDAAGELSNALIDEQLRVSLAAETRTVRELIYRQAFAEADFRDGEA